jgi:hypothetical protein
LLTVISASLRISETPLLVVKKYDVSVLIEENEPELIDELEIVVKQ